ncbi:MAG: hypothetical protein ACLQMO_07500 [Acidobacteriaceae bacterium]
MKEWGFVIALLGVDVVIIQSIYQVGNSIERRLDALHEKVDALREKLEEIDAKQDDMA